MQRAHNNISETGQNTLQVLIVEADKAQRRGIALALQEDFLEIQTTSNPIEAIQLVKTNSYDAIISDIHFPIMDGVHAVILLRVYAPDAMFIVVSAPTNNHILNKLDDIGIQRFMEKPIELEILTKEIQHCFHHLKSNKNHYNGGQIK